MSYCVLETLYTSGIRIYNENAKEQHLSYGENSPIRTPIMNLIRLLNRPEPKSGNTGFFAGLSGRTRRPVRLKISAGFPDFPDFLVFFSTEF